ncbi:MAG: threonine-phosphate decarboxylase CobD [Pseudomonadales bacterium]
MSKESVNITHGGDLDEAARLFAIPREQWLDLSTGIAPWSWPIADIPTEVWQRLPAVKCPLPQAAVAYYGCAAEAVLAIPGSQFAIQTLPQLFPENTRVALPELGYFEHRKAWFNAGHRIVDYRDGALGQLEEKIVAGELDVVLVINPNNPTTTLIDKACLLRWCDRLAGRGGCLIVDEAFMDTDARMSLATECPRPGLIVLRSLGKFFGLAGLRLGFVLAETPVLELLAERLGPWAVNGPAQYLGCRALGDCDWQKTQRRRIQSRVAEQMMLLDSIHWDDQAMVALGPLFVSVIMPLQAVEFWYNQCGRQGVLVRRFILSEREGLLRFGLTRDAEQLQRLKQALTQPIEQDSHSDH